jgi:hypothetical protein
MTGENDDTTDSDGSSTEDSTANSRRNKLRLKACDLVVEGYSHEMDVDEMMEELSPEMEFLMRHHLAGEYEVLEEKDLFEQLFGEN